MSTEACMGGMRMGGLSRLGAVVLAVLFSGQARAATRISLAMRGDHKAVLSTQLAMELCGTYECVLRAKVFAGSRPDFDKARRLRVKGILVGAVSRKRGERTVSLMLLKKPGRPAQKWRFPLSPQGTLTQDLLDQLAKDLEAQLGGAPPRTSAPFAKSGPIPEVSPPPTAASAPAPAEAAAAPSAPAPALPPEPALAVSPEPVRAVPPERNPTTSQEARDFGTPAGEKAKNEERQWLVAAEVGYYGTRRELSYEGLSNAAVNSLRTYEVGFVSSPRLRLELFPFSRATDGALAGLGLFADYSFSLGLKTKTDSGAEQSTSFSRIQAGLTWRIYPSSSSRFALVPAISYQRLRFTVDGGIPGLPNAVLSGVKGSLGFEVPVSDRLTILFGGGYVRWLSPKDLVDAFFTSGSAYAIEVEAGLSVALYGPISLRVLSEYSATKYSLEAPVPGNNISATGAKDEYIGGRAMLRWQL